MGATSTPTKLGSGEGEVMAIGKGRIVRVLTSLTMSTSYATGGDTVTLDPDIRGLKLRGLLILNPFDGTRRYEWDGSTSTPKIKALSAFATEVAAATNLGAVTLQVEFIYEGA